jgi:hypothetical protein
LWHQFDNNKKLADQSGAPYETLFQPYSQI